MSHSHPKPHLLLQCCHAQFGNASVQCTYALHQCRAPTSCINALERVQSELQAAVVPCRKGEEMASQAMKSVSSFLNRILAMAMEDQEIVFK